MNQPVQFTLQSKDVLHDFWVPAFRMKKDAVPGIDVELPRDAEPARRLPDRLRRAVRPRARRDARQRHVVQPQQFDSWLGQLGGKAPAGGGGAAGGGAAAARRTARRLHRPPAACGSATRSPTPARTARSARTSTRCSRARTRPSSSSRSWIPNKVIADGYQADIMPPNFGQTLQPAQIDALVKYL